VLLACTASPPLGQTLVPVDTMLTARGIVELRTDVADTAHRWVVFLPVPITLWNLKTNTLVLAGGERVADRYVDRFVELKARVAVERNAAGKTSAIANDVRLREIQPDGMVQTDVDLSLSQHATVQMAVVPKIVVWRDGSGAPSGVTPTVLFSIINQSQTELRFFFPTNEVVCLRVRLEDEGGGREVTWRVEGKEQLVTLRMGSVFRQILPISDSIAAFPGRYVVRATLCGAEEFHGATEFSVAEH
jgi:hypothetical protein